MSNLALDPEKQYTKTCDTCGHVNSFMGDHFFTHDQPCIAHLDPDHIGYVSCEKCYRWDQIKLSVHKTRLSTYVILS
jgi:hypothetical protein